jgi:hypothetical protein
MGVGTYCETLTKLRKCNGGKKLAAVFKKKKAKNKKTLLLDKIGWLTVEGSEME